MSGIVGSRFNTRGSGLVGSLGSDGQVFTSSGAGVGAVFETASSAITTPAFGASQSGTVSGVGDGSISKILCDTEIFDTDSAYDPSTNYRFTVPSGGAGKYIFYWCAKIRSATLHNLRASEILLRENGSTICSNNASYNQNLALQYFSTAFWVVDSAEDDYYEVFGQPSVDSGTGDINNGRFFGFRLAE